MKARSPLSQKTGVARHLSFVEDPSFPEGEPPEK